MLYLLWGASVLQFCNALPVVCRCAIGLYCFTCCGVQVCRSFVMLYLLWCAGVLQFCNAKLLWFAVVSLCCCGVQVCHGFVMLYLLWCTGVPRFCNALPVVVCRCAAVL